MKHSPLVLNIKQERYHCKVHRQSPAPFQNFFSRSDLNTFKSAWKTTGTKQSNEKRNRREKSLKKYNNRQIFFGRKSQKITDIFLSPKGEAVIELFSLVRKHEWLHWSCLKRISWFLRVWEILTFVLSIGCSVTQLFLDDSFAVYFFSYLGYYDLTKTLKNSKWEKER